MSYLNSYVDPQKTPQSAPIPGSAQVQNNAGGYSWQLDDWGRLDRFLLLGTEGGSYYEDEQALTASNLTAVQRCIAADPLRVVARAVDVSIRGLAHKQDPALLVLAMCAAPAYNSDEKSRALALSHVCDVCRIGTTALHFAAFCNAVRGWGRALRDGMAAWYVRSADDLAYQLVKYQSRDGWTHGDVLRLAHPKPASAAHDALFRWALGYDVAEDMLPQIVQGFERAKRATSSAEIVSLIREYNLPREAIPTQYLNDVSVWEALLERMPLTAMIRNLGKMTKIGLLHDLSDSTDHVVDALLNRKRIRAARVHPIAVLSALRTYASGHGVRGHMAWTPVRRIVDALDQAFYLAFENVPESDKRMMIALDISGSMASSYISGLPGLTPRDASAALALVTVARAPRSTVLAFSERPQPLPISPRERLDDVIHRIQALEMGRTDCALPMLYALQKRLQIDAFIIYTDSETWYGKIHPAQALQQYRRQGIPAKLVVVGMVAGGFSIADPDDAGMIDIAGFSADTPALIAKFIES